MRKFVTYSIFGLFLILGLEIIFFRQYLFSDAIFGTVDSILCNCITEHWFKVMQGKEGLLDLPVFYPAKHTIAHSDMMFLYSIPYNFLRLLGLNMFAACKYSVMIIHLFGTICLFYLLNSKYLGIYANKEDNANLGSKEKSQFTLTNFVITFIGLAICAWANNYLCRIAHIQMAMISLVPLLAYLGLVFWDKMLLTPEKFSLKRLAAGLSFIILFFLILFTSFYTAYFVFTFIFVFVLCFLLFASKECIWHIKNLWTWIKNNIWECCLYTATVVSGVALTVYVYLPVLLEAGGKKWGEVILSSPTLLEFINVSSNNVLYGRLIQKLIVNGSIIHPHLVSGFPFVTLILFFAVTICLILAFVANNNSLKNNESLSKDNNQLPNDNVNIEENTDNSILQEKENQIANRAVSPLLLYTIVAISVLACFVLTLRVGDYSIWWLFYKFIPGASAIRYTSRLNVLLSLPMALSVCGFLRALFNNGKERLCSRKTIQGRFFSFLSLREAASVSLVLALLMGYIFLENITIVTLEPNMTVNSLSNLVTSIPAPPKECKIAYGVCSSPPEETFEEIPFDQTFNNFQLLAWFTALKYDVKTLNGYSSNPPKGWHLYYWNNASYLGLAESWISYNKLNKKDIYAFDVAKGQWFPQSNFANVPIILNYNSKVLFASNRMPEHNLNSIIIQPKDYIHGPYIYMDKGTYSIYLTGKNLKNTTCVPYQLGEPKANGKGEPNLIPGSMVKANDTTFQAVVNLQKENSCVWLEIRNNGDMQAVLDQIVIQPIGGKTITK